MAELGSFRIWYGSESGSQRILDAMQRRVSKEEIQTITKQAQKYGIQAGLFVMLGYPGEEISDIEETVEHLKQANPDIYLTTVAYPIKGTEFYEQSEANIKITGDWETGTDRQLKLRGRFSDRFYWFANRYMVNEVEQYKMSLNENANQLKRATIFLKAKAARLGMELTKESVS
jgi:radical SAM superfamily enzyme YgiQ (UPF0313 family)